MLGQSRDDALTALDRRRAAQRTRVARAARQLRYSRGSLLRGAL